MILLGTDEAGYGPNLGPLVVSATVWSTPTADLAGLGDALRENGIAVGDSKKLYHAAGSLLPLETAVRSAIHVLKTTLENVAATVECSPSWETESPFIQPATLERKRLLESAKDFSKTLDACGVRLLALRSRVLSAELFNRRLETVDSKGTLLSQTTLGIVAELIDKLKKSTEPILVLCDKHGGRNRYLDVLCQTFPGEFFQPITESRPLSVYRGTVHDRSIEFRFQSKGESELSVALASMLSKYLRELSMGAFNSFWCSQIPGLKPTAGYPEDAKRFKAEIAAVQERLGIADDVLWRRK